jgi:large subunit ribosomal protein L3
MTFILGKKIEMTQIWKGKKVTPVTLIEAGPCFVTQIKTKDNDEYEAIQVGFEKIEKKNKIKKTMKGKEFKHIKEQQIPSSEQKLKIGDEINVLIFKEGDKVKISGISKGKGFQGGVKRWGFHGRNATHGTKHEERTLGSVGCGYPQRVIKGKKMPGHMGAERITTKNLEIVKIDKENNLIAVKGAVPGRRGTLLEIRG